MFLIPAFIPSPAQSVWQLGPVPLRAYAFFILVGIFLAVWLGNKRWVARGGLNGQVTDIAMWAVPFGILGGRLYHVLTDWELYFSEGGKGFLGAFRIWEGGLGIWGAIALGAVGAYIGCARQGMKLAPFADAIAPGLVFAQAIGRWGNWFNQELYGRPTSLPWGLEIDRAYRPLDYINNPTFHPTFLYESIACAALGCFLLWADRKFVFGYGRLFALYLAIYCAARGVIETIRVDDALHILGIRLNVFTAIFVGIGALIFYVRSVERFPGQEIIEAGRVVGARSDAEVREFRATMQTEMQTQDKQLPNSESIHQKSAAKVKPAGPRRGRRVAPKE
jgi:prolipoprotein diacylglyceryl transferase